MNENIDETKALESSVADTATELQNMDGRQITGIDLSRILGVSKNTLARWRTGEGACVRAPLESSGTTIDGRKQYVYSAENVRDFLKLNPEVLIAPRARHYITKGAEIQICQRANELVRYPLAEITKKIADETGRTLGKIQIALRAYAENNPESDYGQLFRRTDQTIQTIGHAWQSDMSIEQISDQYGFTEPIVRRAVLQYRLGGIYDFDLEFIPNEVFSKIEPASDEEAGITGPLPEAEDKGLEKIKLPGGLPPYLAALYEVALLTPGQEKHAFRKMNYLKYKASKVREGIDPARPEESDIDQVEAWFLEQEAVRNLIISSNLRLAVSLAKCHATPDKDIFELISDANLSLIKAVRKFDFARGNKFSTYATWAITKNFARTIPEEYTHKSRFTTNYDGGLERATAQCEDEDARLERDKMRKDKVTKILQTLDERERTIINYRYGLEPGHEPMGLREIGAKMVVTKERIRQIEARAVKKLRAAMNGGEGDFEELMDEPD